MKFSFCRFEIWG